MEKSPNDNTVKVFDLRLFLFWKKIFMLSKIGKMTKEILAVELFDFISMIIGLLSKNDVSRFSKLVMVLFIIFHFEQMLDKFEQIDYKDFKSIRLMLPLYNSKMKIVEDLLKT